MKPICLILLTTAITAFYSQTSQAKLPYAQEILLNAEFDRAEKNLEKQIDGVKDMRAKIKAGKTAFDNTHKILEAIFVVSLENLHRQKRMKEFTQLASLLNGDETRKQFYYPVKVNEGFSGSQDYFVSFGDVNCLNIKREYSIESGTLIQLNTGTLSTKFGVGDPTYQMTYKKNKTDPGSVLVGYVIDSEDPFYKVLRDLENTPSDLGKYYTCNYIGKYKQLEKDTKALLKRYSELSRILNRPMRDFRKEKNEKSITEELLELAATLPKTEAPQKVEAVTAPGTATSAPAQK